MQPSATTKSVPLALPVRLYHDQKPIIAIFRWTALAEPVAHEKLAVKTHFCNIVIQRASFVPKFGFACFCLLG